MMMHFSDCSSSANYDVMSMVKDANLWDTLWSVASDLMSSWILQSLFANERILQITLPRLVKSGHFQNRKHCNVCCIHRAVD